MTQEFKVGDKVIVLPSLFSWSGEISLFACRGHGLQPYTTAEILGFENGGKSVICFGSAYCLNYKVEQSIELHQIAPLPIPYSQLDEE